MWPTASLFSLRLRCKPSEIDSTAEWIAGGSGLAKNPFGKLREVSHVLQLFDIDEIWNVGTDVYDQPFAEFRQYLIELIYRIILREDGRDCAVDKTLNDLAFSAILYCSNSILPVVDAKMLGSSLIRGQAGSRGRMARLSATLSKVS